MSTTTITKQQQKKEKRKKILWNQVITCVTLWSLHKENKIISGKRYEKGFHTLARSLTHSLTRSLIQNLTNRGKEKMKISQLVKQLNQ